MKLKIVFSIVLSFLLTSSYAQYRFDAKLENYITKDKFEIAKLYVNKKLSSRGITNKENYIYYNAKAGFIYLRLGKIDSALYYSKNAIKNIEASSKKELKYEAWKSIAYSYCKHGKIDSAMVYTQKLYQAVDNTTNYELKRYANILMGIISFQNILFEDSLIYYKKALELSEITHNITNYKVDYYNIGLAQTALKKYDDGINSLTKAESYAVKSTDKRLLSRIYGTKADNYASQGNDEKRIIYIEKANAVAKTLGDNKLLIMGASHQMQWDYFQGKEKKAFQEGENITKKLKEANLPQLKVADDSLMYVMAKKDSKTSEALFYLESFTKNKMNLLQQNGRKQIEEIRAKYELKNKNLIIDKQKLEIIASKRVNKIMFLTLLVVLVTFSFIGYLYYKRKAVIRLIYKKEIEKDSQIKKLQDRLKSYSLSTIQRNEINPISNKATINSYPILENETVLNEKTRDLFEKIMFTLESEKLFLKPDLNQNTIIKLVGTNKKYLYEAISQNSDLNFRGIINRLRINEAKSSIQAKIKNKQDINFTSLISECGFNSNSSFYRTFKIITGITPNDYAEEYKKDSK